MGFWHTGYIEFHEAVGLEEHQKPDLAQRVVPTFTCETCGNSFWSAAELARHRTGAHPRTRPMLFLRHAPALSTLNVVSVPLEPDDISLTNASTVFLDGEEINGVRLNNVLCGFRREFCEITLVEGSIESCFKIKFEIAEPGDLAEVDRAFREITQHHELTTQRIGDFVNRTKRFESASRYIDGLVQYLFGRLAKQQTGGVHIPYESYRERFNLALDSMRGFNTSLARVIVGLIAFSENVFEGYGRLSHAPRLQAAMQFFNRMLSEPGKAITTQRASEPGFSRARVPADEATENVIEWAHELIAIGRLEDEALLEKCLMSSNYPPDDKLKLSMLLAEHYLLTGQIVAARNHARRYSSHAVFGGWADAVAEAAESMDQT